MQYYVQQILNALQVGSVYALIALGYTMVYGILTLINFAHGDIFMVSTYIAFFRLNITSWIDPSSAAIIHLRCYTARCNGRNIAGCSPY
jgi:branched-subunit amino acid ABC-type transport system permease component